MSDALWRIAFWRFGFFYHVRRCQKNAQNVLSQTIQSMRYPIAFFSVGLEGLLTWLQPKVADHIGTIHHEIKFTIQEGLDAVKDVIYNETYDVTTIRASTQCG
jgi:asparagine synthetase B (glutamine-hydrolysing)